ncbi:hypothetical protein Hanom_Chr03g00211201 [Helianthus anomalus]
MLLLHTHIKDWSIISSLLFFLSLQHINIYTQKRQIPSHKHRHIVCPPPSLDHIYTNNPHLHLSHPLKNRPATAWWWRRVATSGNPPSSPM